MFTLFELALQHQFFRNSLWLNAKIVPDTVTSQWMNRFQMQLTSNSNCWELFGHAISGRADFLRNLVQLTAGEPFRFWICQPLANFVMLTDLPVNWQGLLHYDNRQSSAHSDKPTAELPATTIPFHRAPTDAVAEVVIYPEALGIQSRYLITLQSRAAQWEYRLIQRGLLKLRQPQIIDESGQVSFPAPTPYHADDGDSGWRFSSGTHRLPLAQVPEQRFKLIDQQRIDTAEQTVQRTILPVLPTPRAEQFCRAPESGDLVSVMYVYL